MTNEYKVDRDSYFKQYAWAMENYDLRAIFMAFLEKENSITDESIKESLYKNFIENNENKIVTDLQLDVLNYVLKLENGIYKTNDIIFESDEPGSKSFDILEPGFYLFELYGASGQCVDKNKNFLLVNPNENNITFTDGRDLIKLSVSKDLRFFLEIKNKDTYTRVKGTVELNQDYVFLFSDEITEGNILQSDNPNFEAGPGPLKFYDFFKFQSNPLEKDFFYLKSVLNKYSLFNTNSYDGLKKKYLSYNSFNYDNVNECNYAHYKNIIKSNIRIGTLKEFEFSSFLKEKDFFNENYLHGGDGGYCSVIVYIDKEQKVTYTVGSYSSETDTNLYFVDNDGLRICAECGCKSSKNKYSKTNEAIYAKNLKDIITNNNFRDDSSKNGEENVFNFHVGENFDYRDYKSGCGRAYAAFNGGNALFCTYGGGQLGSGLRLNNFNTAYYQKPENGKIKVTYLGSLYSKYVLFNDMSNDNNVECLTHIIKTDNGQSRLPLNCEINFKFSTPQYDGGIKIDGIIDGKNISNKDRVLNYISFKLKSNFDENIDFIYSFNSKNKYIDFTEDKDNFILKNTANFYDKVSGYETEENFTLNLKFLYSKSYITNLLYAYNKFNNAITKTGETSYNAYLQSFDENSYDSSYVFSTFKCIKIINIFESIIAISFNYESTKVNLPAINDSYDNHIFNADTGYIEKIKYTLADETDDSKYYTYNNKFIIPVGSSMIIKLFYNTGRVTLDESLSTYNGNFDLLDKNVDLFNKYHPYDYFDSKNNENYQYIKFIPASSQEVKFVIKKYTFNLSILPDIYGQFNVSCLENKIDFEPGEEVNLSFPLKNYIRVSHLLNAYKKGLSDYDKNLYKVNDSLHKFESFFQIGHDDDLNICDIKIKEQLSRFDCYDSFKNKLNADGVFCLSQREINKISFNYDSNISSSPLSKITYVAYKPQKEELVIVRFYFKENDISLRFTADYNPCEKIIVLENGDSSILSIFKNYSFVLYGCGGPTGNGQSGGSGHNSENVSGIGGNGGDGYVGGNGGNGGNTKHWKPDINKWGGFIPVGVVLIANFGGQGGLAGRGFSENGAQGTYGRNILTNACAGPLKNGDEEKREDACKKCIYYASFPRSIKIDIYSNSTSANSLKLYLSSGRQGYSFVSNAGIEKDGHGGGGGVASLLYAINNETFIDYVKNSGNKFGNFNINTKPKSQVKSIIFEGGIAGLYREDSEHRYEGWSTVWEFPSSNKATQEDASVCTITTHFFEADQLYNGQVYEPYSFRESFFDKVGPDKRFSKDKYTHTNNGTEIGENFLIKLNNKSMQDEAINSTERIIFTNDKYATRFDDSDDTVKELKNNYTIRGNSYFSYETGILGIMPIGYLSASRITRKTIMDYNSFVSGDTYEELKNNESSEEGLY